MSESEDHRRPELSAIAELLALAGRLKSLPRKGWVDRGVEQPESVADHSFRLALMTLVVAARDPRIDGDRALRIALIHDLPEAITGDITPFDEYLEAGNTERDELFRRAPRFSERAHVVKKEAERQAMLDLTRGLPSDLSTILVEAWEEYEAGESPEATLVRQLDKLETWLQAREYQSEMPGLTIESFRLGTDRDVSDPELRELRRAIDALFDG